MDADTRMIYLVINGTYKIKGRGWVLQGIPTGDIEMGQRAISDVDLRQLGFVSGIECSTYASEIGIILRYPNEESIQKLEVGSTVWFKKPKKEFKMFKKIMDKIEGLFDLFQTTYKSKGLGRDARRARYAKKYPERY